jgi:intraflagellar transport protein 122
MLLTRYSLISNLPDNTLILLAVGDRVLFYKADTMEFDNYVKGHKDVVNCIAYSKDS